MDAQVLVKENICISECGKFCDRECQFLMTFSYSNKEDEYGCGRFLIVNNIQILNSDTINIQRLPECIAAEIK